MRFNARTLEYSGEENNFKEFVSSIKASNEGKYDWLVSDDVI